ncbi:MAG: DNA internalization-related competence protein ComEC/Rec2 [Pseudohongiellaceae bacterium]
MRFFLSAFCLGILCVTRASDLALIRSFFLALCALLILIATSSLCIRRFLAVKQRASLGIWLSACMVFCCGALFHVVTAEKQLDRQLPEEFEGIPLLIEGVVLNLPSVAGDAYRFEFAVRAACLVANPMPNKDTASVHERLPSMRTKSAGHSACGNQIPFSGRILLSYYMPSSDDRTGGEAEREERPLYYPAELRPGSRLQLTVKLNRPHGFSNPGGFDYEALLFRNKILAKGYVRGALEVRSVEKQGNGIPSLFLLIEQLRFEIRKRVLDNSESMRHTGIILALGLGDSSLITQAVWNQLRETGTTHLLVVSGLHVGMIAVFLLLLSRALWRLVLFFLPLLAPLVPSRQVFSLCSSVIGTTVFAFFSGWGLPAQRAVLMLAVFASAKLTSRRFGVVSGLLLALTFVLIGSPLAATGSGFWLSFAAVLALVLAAASPQTNKFSAEGNNGDSPTLSWLSRQAKRLVLPQLIVALALFLPLLVLGIDVSLLAPLVNLLAIPLLTFALLPASLLAVLDLALFEESALGVFLLAERLCDQLFLLLAAVAEFEFVWAPQVTLSSAHYLLLVVCLCLCLFPVAWRTRCVCGFWVTAITLTAIDWRAETHESKCSKVPASLRLNLLDVGQGLSLVIRTNCHTLLYDTGASLSADFEMGSVVIKPALRALGIKKLDRLVISHADNDHAGGAAGVLASIPIADIHAGGYAENNEAYAEFLGKRAMSLRSCRAGESWRWDGVVFSYLSPTAIASDGEASSRDRTKNSQSCVLRIALGESVILLTGDIERNDEVELALRYEHELKTTLLIAPHHGSKTSSSYALLKRATPEVAFIAAGYKNSFGHPHSEVLSRYALLGIEAFNTATRGMLSEELNRQGRMSYPRAYRETHRRYWRPILKRL